MKRGVVSSAVLVAVVVGVVLLVGAIAESGPSEDVVANSVAPTTTSTTEPAPEGVFIVRLVNGSFRPSNLKIDLDEYQIVRWINEDDREYEMRSRGDGFEATVPPGGQFEFDYSTLPPGIYRYSASVGLQRLPGTVDTRPNQ